MRSILRGLSLAWMLALWALPAAAENPRFGEQPPITDEQRQRVTRRLQSDARALLREDRAEAAERTARRALALAPDDPDAHALLARVLTELGRDDEARVHRARANALDPPPPPLPMRPIAIETEGIAVALVPPAPSPEPAGRVAEDWPDGPVATTLEQRLRLRLPGASVRHADPASIEEARTWLAENARRGALSLRVDRSYCGDTVKDGRFAVAQLRVAAELPGASGDGPDGRRLVLRDPRGPEDCRGEVLARAVEHALKQANVRRVLAHSADSSGSAWSTLALRALFPGLGVRIAAALGDGRGKLSAGRVADALADFERAAAVDPEDPIVRTYLREARSTLAMVDEIESRRDPEAIAREDRGILDPRFSPAQRAASEARLAEERRLRQELLAAHAVLTEGAALPASDILATLRRGEILEADTFGRATALRLAGGPVEVRVAYTPGGHELARYYFAVGADEPVLRTEDIDEDGRPNRFIAYRAGHRSEIWEDGAASGTPQVHYVFGADGEVIARVAIDRDGNGRDEKVLRYDGSVLRAEDRDTDGDGVLDRFDRFDDAGRVVGREEDLDGDGEIDMTSTYREGRLVERSIRELELAPDDD